MKLTASVAAAAAVEASLTSRNGEWLVAAEGRRSSVKRWTRTLKGPLYRVMAHDKSMVRAVDSTEPNEISR